MPQGHEEIVREIFRKWAQGDFRSAASFDEHTAFVIRSDFPEEAVLLGLPQFQDYMRRFLQQWQHIAFDADRLEVVGDTVLARVAQHSTGSNSGVTGSMRMFLLFTFRGDVIVRMEAILHEADAYAALGIAPSS